MTVSVVISNQGRVSAQPSDMYNTVITNATALSPGLTTNLPGSLIADVVETGVAQCLVSDSAATELINSISPRTANMAVLNQIGQVVLGPLGVVGAAANSSVNVVFSAPANSVIPAGFIVSDGTNQFVTQHASVTSSGGVTTPVYCIASSATGITVAANTVTTVVSAQPPLYTITVNNPLPGAAGTGTELPNDYRNRIVTANAAPVGSAPSVIRSQIASIPGVVNRTIRVLQLPAGAGIMVAGGDPALIAGAIYNSGFFAPLLGISVNNLVQVTGTTNVQMKFSLAHHFSPGSTLVVTGETLSPFTSLDGVTYTVLSVVDQFTVITNATLSSYSGNVSGNAFLQSNPRNTTVGVVDYPDTYSVNYIQPIPQLVSATVTWNTLVPAFASASQLQQNIQTAIASFINSIPAGNSFTTNDIANAALNASPSLLSPTQFSNMSIAVSFDGITAPFNPSAPITYLADSQGYLYTSTTGSNITVLRG